MCYTWLLTYDPPCAAMKSPSLPLTSDLAAEAVIRMQQTPVLNTCDPELVPAFHSPSHTCSFYSQYTETWQVACADFDVHSTLAVTRRTT
jgi:hypothetical protein